MSTLPENPTPIRILKKTLCSAALRLAPCENLHIEALLSAFSIILIGWLQSIVSEAPAFGQENDG